MTLVIATSCGGVSTTPDTQTGATNISVDSVAIFPPSYGAPVGTSTGIVVTLYSAPPRTQVTTLRRQYKWIVANPAVVSLDTTSATTSVGQGSPAAPFIHLIGQGKTLVTVTVEGRSASMTAQANTP
jgi:hypothetical protein